MANLRDVACLAVGAGAGLAIAAYLRRGGSSSGGASEGNGDGGLDSYDAPSWAPPELRKPEQRLRLAHLPTPIHRWELPGVDEDTEVCPPSPPSNKTK